MATLRAREDAAKDVLLLRAIEGEDPMAVVLTREDRDYASAAALGSSRLDDDSRSRGKMDFLARRARFALDRLTPRYPGLERVTNASGWPKWLGWGLPLLALAAGLASNVVEGRQLNILAFPLLGMLLWNLAVYAWLLIAQVKRSIMGARDEGAHPLLRLFEWALQPPGGRLASHPTLERAVSRFARDWSAASARLTYHRASLTLHAAAAMFAVGVVAGMVARARYTAEYSAGWAGTWAGAENEIAAFLGVLLAPASLLTGIELPTAERLRALRGTAENAGDWLILWVTTTGLLVVVPRLLLAAFNAVRAAMLKRRLPLEEDFYVRSVLRNALGKARRVRVIPYAFDPGGEAGKTLTQLLTEALGAKTQVSSDPPVPYGQEDAWLAREGASLAEADHLVLLFSLGSTPEAENHGAFSAGVRQRLGKGHELTVLLDEGGFRRKFQGQPSGQRRVEDRLQAWRAVLAPAGLSPITVRLDSSDEPGAAAALEQAMQRTAAPA